MYLTLHTESYGISLVGVVQLAKARSFMCVQLRSCATLLACNPKKSLKNCLLTFGRAGSMRGLNVETAANILPLSNNADIAQLW